MNENHRALLTASSIGGGLLVIVLIWSAPHLLWIPALAAVAVFGAVVAGNARRPIEDPLEKTSAEPLLPSVPHYSIRIDEMLLPSSQEDYAFRFSATVRWSPLEAPPGRYTPDANLSALAIVDVLRRARQVTARWDPAESSFVRHELGGLLGRMRDDSTGSVRAMAESVQLSLLDGDRERIDRLATLRKEKAVWEHERKHEQSKREYLGKDVLKSPGSAVIWSLARNGDQVGETVRELASLVRLYSAANNAPIPEIFQQYVPGLVLSDPVQDKEPRSLVGCLDAFVKFEDERQRSLFIQLLADSCVQQGLTDLAGELLHEFTPPEPPPEPPVDPAGPPEET